MQGIAILGSTGSIGCQTLKVIEEQPNSFEVKALVAGSNRSLLLEQVKKFKPSLAVLVNETSQEELQYRLKDDSTKFLTGEEGILEAIHAEGVDLVLNAIVGAAGLKPTLAAIRAGKTVALANKESLVIGGSLVMPLVKDKGALLLPVDSEHSAIFQALEGQKGRIERILLTASGGPFRDYTKEELALVTLEDALKHPTWDMGGKITIDSATLMNKGLEVIEAHWLFDVEYDKIEVVVHPQSIVHSLVEFEDASILAQLGLPDMRGPIHYALNYPKRRKNTLERLSLTRVGRLDFLAPNSHLFPCLRLAYQAGEEGGTAPVVLNGANEALVDLFLKKAISFLKIPEVIERVLSSHRAVTPKEEEEIYYWDGWARKRVIQELGGSI